MDQRGQFTLYASVFESAKRIKNKAARADFYDAVCDYALNGVEPNLDKLSDAAAIGFISAKPNLDSSRKKAANGKQGGSKRQANSKQTVSEKEIEIEIEKEYEKEIEYEIENECYIYNSCGDGDEYMREATADELEQIGLVPGVYIGLTAGTVEQIKKASGCLVKKHMGRDCVPADCRYITSQILTLGGRCTSIDKDRVALLDYAMGQAVASGRPNEWPYVIGILARLSARGITTVKQAICYDMERPDKEGYYD